jgi:hypothetical protein
MLTWLMEDAVGEEKDPRNLTLRVLAVNFAAVNSTSRVSYLLLTFSRARIQHSRAGLYLCIVPTAGSVSHALQTMQTSHDIC